MRGLEPHSVLNLAVEEAVETVARVCVTEDSLLASKSLRKARVSEETLIWVLAIRRAGQATRHKPRARIEAKDVFISSGYADGEGNLKKLACACESE